MAGDQDQAGLDAAEIIAVLRANPDAMAAVEALRSGDRDGLRRALTALVGQVAPGEEGG